MLLLLLIAALTVVLASEVNVGDDQQPETLSATTGSDINPLQPAIYTASPPAEQVLLRVPTHGTIRGRVTSAEWAVWPSEVVVELLSISNNSVIASYGCHRSENDFIFQDLVFGKYKLRLTGDRIQAFVIEVKISAESPNVFQAMALRTTSSISGIVYDTAGNPASNVQVVATFQHQLEGFFAAPQLAITDSEGKFTITGIRPGTHKVFVGAKRNPLSEVQLININTNSPDAYAQFTINQFGRATVFVNLVKSNNEAAEQYKKIRISAERLSSDPKFQLSLPANELGVAQFNALPPGRYVFTAYGGGFKRTHLTASVIEGKNSELKINLSEN